MECALALRIQGKGYSEIQPMNDNPTMEQQGKDLATMRARRLRFIAGSCLDETNASIERFISTFPEIAERTEAVANAFAETSPDIIQRTIEVAELVLGHAYQLPQRLAFIEQGERIGDQVHLPACLMIRLVLLGHFLYYIINVSDRADRNGNQQNIA